MFSDKEVKLGNDTIEYAWLVEVQCGELKGKFTPLHVSVFNFLILYNVCN